MVDFFITYTQAFPGGSMAGTYTATSNWAVEPTRPERSSR